MTHAAFIICLIAYILISLFIFINMENNINLQLQVHFPNSMCILACECML